MSQIVVGLRTVAGGSLPPNPPPANYLWLYDDASNQYFVDDNNNYILVPTPYIPWS